MHFDPLGVNVASNNSTHSILIISEINRNHYVYERNIAARKRDVIPCYIPMIMVTSKIKHDFFYLDFLLFWSKQCIASWLKSWKNPTKSLHRFQSLNMPQKFPQLKKFGGSFLIRIKITLFVVPLIVSGKLKDFDGLQIHLKRVLRGSKETCKVQS